MRVISFFVSAVEEAFLDHRAEVSARKLFCGSMVTKGCCDLLRSQPLIGTKTLNLGPQPILAGSRSEAYPSRSNPGIPGSSG